MTPMEKYQSDVERGAFQYDPAQEAVVKELQRIYDELSATRSAPTGLWKRLKGVRALTRVNTILGLYVWSGVGRGKTHLMNLFHDALPFKEKMRRHFHRFMQQIHAELKTLPEIPDPLQIVADRIAKEARVLCFDEFHVSDIADAMVLGRLMSALMDRGVILVTTSNIQPDDLYQDGLQRARFLPAIDLIKKHTRVIHLEGSVDYRLRALEQAKIYYYPLDKGADESLMRSFIGLGPENVKVEETLAIEGRQISTIRVADGIVWFDFKKLCEGPRGIADYIEIAQSFHTVLLANVPLLGPEDNEKALRFIHLVDEFYDRNVNLIISAAAPPTGLYYPEGRLAFQFQRTESRLEEMRSHEYLAKKHLP
uniref:Cell division protein ZapE n=1 Tax=Candidatus Kentrum sp. TUN TaxID=2126343 RepID=A0A450ZM77_9GAMM|nr:MAG: cell division protein ZapE [Candidatus Kentron sp. TUN]VFK55790.1 MAG: cell division protein ZapE [Candidatus Kentron sp. TUN]VFK61796.1 MAG: cell division protein ZapE [Candidatus Kentron sp. TUN]